jgi:hypothetical protein
MCLGISTATESASTSSSLTLPPAVARAWRAAAAWPGLNSTTKRAVSLAAKAPVAMANERLAPRQARVKTDFEKLMSKELRTK